MPGDASPTGALIWGGTFLTGRPRRWSRDLLHHEKQPPLRQSFVRGASPGARHRETFREKKIIPPDFAGPNHSRRGTREKEGYTARK